MSFDYRRSTSRADSPHLTPEERALIDLKHTVLDLVRRARLRTPISQRAIPRRVRFGELEVARLEAKNASVSLDLLAKAALAAEAQRTAVARVLGENATWRS